MKALLVGNSPALNLVDLDRVDRKTTAVFGVNRLWHQSDPKRQWIKPDVYCTLEDSMEEEWLPGDGEIEGFLAWDKSRFAERDDAIIRRRGAPLDSPWPTRWDRYLKTMLSPEFLFQYILEHEMVDIGIIGIDYTQHGLDDLEMKTHCWGSSSHAASAPRMGDGEPVHKEEGLCFWRKALAECVSRSIQLWNLSPYDDTPFHAAEIPTKRFEEWCSCSPS